MQDSELEERRKLAATPGLTRAQRALIEDPTTAMAIAQHLVTVLRRNAGDHFAAKSDEEKSMARAFRETEFVPLFGVSYANGVQTFGGAVEVEREGVAARKVLASVEERLSNPGRGRR